MLSFHKLSLKVKIAIENNKFNCNRLGTVVTTTNLKEVWGGLGFRPDVSKRTSFCAERVRQLIEATEVYVELRTNWIDSV